MESADSPPSFCSRKAPPLPLFFQICIRQPVARFSTHFLVPPLRTMPGVACPWALSPLYHRRTRPSDISLPSPLFHPPSPQGFPRWPCSQVILLHTRSLIASSFWPPKMRCHTNMSACFFPPSLTTRLRGLWLVHNALPSRSPMTVLPAFFTPLLPLDGHSKPSRQIHFFFPSRVFSIADRLRTNHPSHKIVLLRVLLSFSAHVGPPPTFFLYPQISDHPHPRFFLLVVTIPDSRLTPFVFRLYLSSPTPVPALHQYRSSTEHDEVTFPAHVPDRNSLGFSWYRPPHT